MKVKSGGGIDSRVVRHAKAGKAEPNSKEVPPAYAGRLGSMQGNHSTGKGKFDAEKVEMYGRVLSGPVGPTDNVKAVGVGGGRTIYKAGSQAATPAARPLTGPKENI